MRDVPFLFSFFFFWESYCIIWLLWRWKLVGITRKKETWKYPNIAGRFIIQWLSLKTTSRDVSRAFHDVGLNGYYLNIHWGNDKWIEYEKNRRERDPERKRSELFILFKRDAYMKLLAEASNSCGMNRYKNLEVVDVSTTIPLYGMCTGVPQNYILHHQECFKIV